MQLLQGDSPIHRPTRGRSRRDANRGSRARSVRAALDRQGTEYVPGLNSGTRKAPSRCPACGLTSRVMNVSTLAAGWPFAILLMLYARCIDRAPLRGMVIEKDHWNKALVLELDGIAYPVRIDVGPRPAVWTVTRSRSTTFTPETTSR